jgi:Rieske Fe-S protein
MHKGQSLCTHLFVPASKPFALFVVAAIMTMIAPAIAQTAAAPAKAELQQHLAEIKQSSAANQQKLRQYQWTETTNVTLKGQPKPPKQSLARYGPDGKVQKTPIDTPQPQPQQQQAGGRGGRIKQRVIEKKKEEFQEYGAQIKTLLALYLPPDPQHMQQAFQAGKASLNKGSGTADIVFHDYALPGDQMTLSFDTAAKKISTINVKTYMDDPKDTVTLAVQFASLPDGTHYVQKTDLNATAKQLQVTTISSNFQPLTPQ